jgi:lipid-A-disaccharide synthase
MTRSIFLSAGEASGDARGAELIRALKAQDATLTFFGMGGPKMRAEGMEVLVDVSDLAVVGIIEVLKHYGTFKKAMTLLENEIRIRKPQAVIGIDYPGFNLRLLKKVRGMFERGTPPHVKIIQYVSPQLWAWDEKRKWKMAQYIDLVLCIFPFEPKVYNETNLKAVYVGHPLVNSITPSSTRHPQWVAFFPGSREKEIRAHMPVFVETEKLIHQSHPETQFAYAASNSKNEVLIHSYQPQAKIETPHSLYSSAGAGIVCSGTATLEAALHGLPMCVVYRVAWPTYWMGRALIKVPYLAMPNILAGRALVKEYIQGEFHAQNLRSEIELLTRDEQYRSEISKGYQELRQQFGSQDAAKNGAQEILSLI